MHRQVGALRKVLSQQTIGVLIRAALPWALRIAKINVDVCRQREPSMVRKFLATVPGQDGGDALSDEDAAEGGDRDGDARARLQPHARDEHRRYQTAPRRDPGLRSVYCCARRVTVQVAQHGSRLRPDSLQTRSSKNMLRRSRPRGSRPAACSFWGRKKVFTRPGSKPENL